jgi:hypothetical protein
VIYGYQVSISSFIKSPLIDCARLGKNNRKILVERFITSRRKLSFYDKPLPFGWTLPRCLETCRPRLKAAFVLEHGAGDHIRLEMEFKQTEESTFEQRSRRWLRLRSDGTAASDFLHVNILDIENP